MDKTDSMITTFSEAVAVEIPSGTLIPSRPKDLEVAEEGIEKTGFLTKLIH